MNELEKLVQAKDYLDKLSNGIDPITDDVLSEDTALNNVSLLRCFFYVSDILRKVIENNGVVARPARRNDYLPPFVLPEDKRDKIEITKSPAMIRQFTERINSLIDENIMRRLKVTALTGWLVSNGFLCEEIINDNSKLLVATVDYLLEHESMDGAEFKAFCENGGVMPEKKEPEYKTEPPSTDSGFPEIPDLSSFFGDE